jgi:hypothetical protein
MIGFGSLMDMSLVDIAIMLLMLSDAKKIGLGRIKLSSILGLFCTLERMLSRLSNQKNAIQATFHVF